MHELREPATEGGQTHADLITRRKAIHRLRINRRQLNRFVADGQLAAVTTEGKGPHFERSEVERFRSSAALRRWKHRRYALTAVLLVLLAVATAGAIAVTSHNNTIAIPNIPAQCPAGFPYYDAATGLCYQQAPVSTSTGSGSGVIAHCPAAYPYYDSADGECYQRPYSTPTSAIASGQGTTPTTSAPPTAGATTTTTAAVSESVNEISLICGSRVSNPDDVNGYYTQGFTAQFQATGPVGTGVFTAASGTIKLLNWTGTDAGGFPARSATDPPSTVVVLTNGGGFQGSVVVTISLTTGASFNNYPFRVIC